ncbi:CGNR zinc finger domain-containing protein [Streptomyces sp. NPDC052396]|uniref:CGNR zinc finger domain-containing protein n=1 Tax=Streptomyces sp. NPDC052396 TaxID=3365689 RepID=UPI0037D5D0C2
MVPPAAPADPMLAFPFFGGRPCLDFVATLGRRHATPVERLPDPAALARWIEQARLGGPADEARVTTGDLAAARTLREATHRLLTAAMAGRAPDPADADQVNQAARRPDLVPQLALRDGRPELHTPSGQPVRAVLSTVARDAVLLVGGPLLDRVKECGNPDCSLLFLDDSQARRRRWCSMDRCGNLAKVAGYRSRSRTTS